MTTIIILGTLTGAVIGLLVGLAVLVRFTRDLNDRVMALEGEPVFGSDFEPHETNFNIHRDFFGPIGVDPS